MKTTQAHIQSEHRTTGKILITMTIDHKQHTAEPWVFLNSPGLSNTLSINDIRRLKQLSQTNSASQLQRYWITQRQFNSENNL